MSFEEAQGKPSTGLLFLVAAQLPELLSLSPLDPRSFWCLQGWLRTLLLTPRFKIQTLSPKLPAELMPGDMVSLPCGTGPRPVGSRSPGPFSSISFEQPVPTLPAPVGLELRMAWSSSCCLQGLLSLYSGSFSPLCLAGKGGKRSLPVLSRCTSPSNVLLACFWLFSCRYLLLAQHLSPGMPMPYFQMLCYQ